MRRNDMNIDGKTVTYRDFTVAVEDMQDRVRTRKLARGEAQSIVEMLGDKFTDDVYREAFLKTITPLIPEDEAKPEPLIRLGSVLMPFGEHKDKPLHQIPLDYLDWLVLAQEKFLKQLQAYLKHPDVKRETRDERK